MIKLPFVQAPISDAGGKPTRAFYAVLEQIIQGVEGQISDLTDLVNGLADVAKSLGSPEGSTANIISVSQALSAKVDNTRAVTGAASIQGGSALSKDVVLTLKGDKNVPGAHMVYSTDENGARGWFPQSLPSYMTTDYLAEGADNLYFTDERAQDAVGAALTNSANVTFAYDDAANTITADLTTLTDAGGGALLRLVRDAWGRITGTSTPSTTDLAEGSNLYFTATRVLATVLAGLSTATNAAITAADSVLSALGKLQAQISANVTALAGKLAKSANLSDVADASIARTNLGVVIPQGYIDGLQMQWVSGTAVTVSSGAAYIPSLANVLQVNSAIALSGLVLSASTWYHLYLYDNAGTPAVECVTTAPATPYSGTARSKTGDTTRRYIGSVRTDASGNLLSFYHEAQTGTVHYRVDLNNATLHLVNNGTATSDASVSAATAVPVTARTMLTFAENNATSGIVFISNADAGSPANSNILAFIRASRSLYGDLQLTSTQTFTYMVTSPALFACYCSGYRFAR